MKGEEALKALFENKTVIADWGTYRMVDGVLMHGSTDSDSFYPSTITINNFLASDFNIQDEFHLTFQEALKAMLDGKAVMCETAQHSIWRVTEKGFEVSPAPCPQRGGMTTIANREQKAKWRVVE